MSDSLKEDLSIEENEKNINIKNEISELLKQKKKNHLIGKENVNKLDTKIRKERLILQLIRDCRYYEKDEKEKEDNLIEVTTKRERFKDNLKSTIKYHNELKEQLCDYLEEIQSYENKLNELNKERENIVSSSFSLMQKKAEEKLNYQKEISETTFKIEQQDVLIKNLNERIDNLENQKENEKKKLMQREIQDIERYNKLYKRYSDLLNKFNMYENEEDNKFNNEIAITKKAYEDYLYKEDLKIKLTEEKIKNEFLQKNIDDISNKVNLISNNENMNNLIKMNGFKKNEPKTNVSTIYSTTVGNYSKY
jgi:myosin heavy subunit